MKEFPKQYIPSENEDKIYKRWEESGFFNPDNIQSEKRYCNILPPPNANGELHVGHASGYAYMDIFGRFERMNGKKVLLLPGKDHAGIQTQVVFEKKLKDERGVDRKKLGREKFYHECYKFCQERANYMRSQEKKLGISADWGREKFTLDPKVINIALDTFLQMHKDGMIYQGRRIINWCPSCATALSDIEVERKEEEGKLYYIQYPIKNSKEFIVIATTRPETMLGDAAVAVHPKDQRYFNFIGKTVILPLQNREIPIIADRRIAIDFGTGAVKVTPAHDPLDWQIGKAHNLGEYQVINEGAKITKLGREYAGLDVLTARKNILEDLSKLGLLGKEEAIKISKLVCERCKSTIEPLISKQWFLDVDSKKFSLKKESLKAIRSGKINFYPDRFRKIMISWLTNLEDWCLSRQIWWGPRIPVWYRKKSKVQRLMSRVKGDGSEIETYIGLEHPKGDGWIQEEDTFDTWFSSGQWAYTTLGYPDRKDYSDYYPTDTMVMGRDILFLWASRMIMLGLYRTKKIPFKNLYFTGLIRDKDGHKMSKSRGNGIDPLEMVEKFGSDALRLSSTVNVSPGQDSRLYEEKIEKFRNFVTKLWNMSRYSASSTADFQLRTRIRKRDIATIPEKWIVSELEKTAKLVTDFLKKKNVTLAQEQLRKFTWDDFADWYIEIHKIENNPEVLGYLLDKVLKLWHPFAPFVTEEIYSRLSGGTDLLMMAKWPASEKKFYNGDAEESFRDLRDMVVKIRNIKANYHINPAEQIDAYSDKMDEKNIIEKLARIKISPNAKTEEGMLEIRTNKRVVRLDISGLIDLEKEAGIIRKEMMNLENLIKKTKSLLANKKFTAGAGKEIVEAYEKRLLVYKEKMGAQKELMRNLEYLEIRLK